MAEYYAVLKKAIDELADNRAEVRRAVYGELRNALIAELKAIAPPLGTAEILRRRIELEEAIRKVEREATTDRGSVGTPISAGVASPERKPLLVAPSVAAASEPVKETASSPQEARQSPANVLRRALQRTDGRADPAVAASRPAIPVRNEPVTGGPAAEPLPDREPIIERAQPPASGRRARNEAPPREQIPEAAAPPDVALEPPSAPARAGEFRATPTPLRLVPTPAELSGAAPDRPSPQEVFRRALQETETRASATTGAGAIAGEGSPLTAVPEQPESAAVELQPDREPVIERAPLPLRKRRERADSPPLDDEAMVPVPRGLEPRAPTARQLRSHRGDETVGEIEPTARPSRFRSLIVALLIIAVIVGAGALAWSKRATIGELIASLDSNKPAPAGTKLIPPAVPASDTSAAASDRPAAGAAGAADASPTARTDDAAGTSPPAADASAAANPPPAGSAAPEPLIGSATNNGSVADNSAGSATPTRGYAILREEVVDLTGTKGGAASNGLKAEVTWRYVENGDTGPAIEADLQVPERRMKVTLIIHKNMDASLPASHLVEIKFDAPGDIPGKGIDNVSRIRMKPTALSPGKSLAGASVKVADGFFWFALSAAGDDVSANLGLLREEDWIDVPFAYTTGQRAILTIRKGTVGDQVFQKAMAAWTAG